MGRARKPVLLYTPATNEALAGTCQVLVKVLAKMLDHSRDRVRGHLTQTADRGDSHRLGQVAYEAEVFAAKTAGHHFLDDLDELLRAHAARNTFAARFIAIKLHAVEGVGHDVGVV